MRGGILNIHKSLTDGGKFAAAVWSTADKVPQLSIPINIARSETNTQLPPPDTPGPFVSADQKLLYTVFESAGFRDMQLEKVNVTFKFDTAENFTKFTQDIAAPVNAILKNQSKNRSEKIWNKITQEVTRYTTNTTITDSSNSEGQVTLNNEAICIVGIK